ncbi:kynureninase [Microlunatus endophyticus]|uniref:Kynureninase n=1 Tax=Microlunatus endophyticus TaxID=1716077 RepID=A0A917W1T0_9ACTN|nr:aminotransferase class V-fold PLP-dependent enzyme [Microlunatus endophyticus]GGL57677.1 kynureninase [Microlunatus endophyticus]
MTVALERGAELDRSDPLRDHADRFVPTDGSVRAYLDGNSLGRPAVDLAQVMADFINHSWGSRLIRGWDEEWMDWPLAVGDALAAAALGAAAGQTIIADSTSVLIYKLARAALSLRSPERDEIVVDVDNFPTDRYLISGIADELGLRLRWIRTDADLGITPDLVARTVGERTALFLASHISYRSGYIADAAEITRIVHAAGAPVLWDLCHSVGAIPIALDNWQVDFAVGCGYKFLNGGPGAPAFGYVGARHQDQARQPLQGWMGHARPFEMGPGYQPHPGIRSFLTGTPPILAMVPLRHAIGMITEVGLDAIRAKSLALTDFAIELIDERLVPLGVRLASPRDHEHRGGHVTIVGDGFAEVKDELWKRGVLPDFRRPDGIRLGLSPLSTRFAEVALAVEEIADILG